MVGVSLFSSGGIGDLALRACNVEVCVANELLTNRAEVFIKNFPNCNMLQGDIWTLKDRIILESKKSIKNNPLDFLIATPPCQGMSKNGQGKLLNQIRQGLKPKYDKRNELIIPTLEIIEELLPEIVLLENVPEMKNTVIPYKGKVVNITDLIQKKLSPLGYEGLFEVIQFADYGVPQRRKRLITVYSKNKRLKDHLRNFGNLFPRSTHSKKGDKLKTSWVTVRDAIGKLEELDSKNQKLSVGKTNKYHKVPVLDKKKYFWVSNTPQEKGAFDNQCVKCDYNQNKTHIARRNSEGINRPSEKTNIFCDNCGSLLPRPHVFEKGEYRLMRGFTSAYRRMKWDEPSTTLTTNFSYVSSDNKIHPEQNRVLSIYEAFKLHTLDRYDFMWEISKGVPASDTLIKEIIGESVPPFGLEIIINHLIEIYNGSVTTLKTKSPKVSKIQSLFD